MLRKLRDLSLLTLSVVLSCPSILLAQDSGSGNVPSLPPVEVLPPAEPTPLVPFDDGGETAIPNFQGEGPTTVLDGTIFDTPVVSGYRADSSTTGSIINLPDADYPGTVNVIPRDVLDDQIVLQLEDLTRNAGGVVNAGDGLFADRIFLRGLEVGSRNFRKDGFLDPTYVPRDFQNVERVEILKGPASVLYGAADPAGLVNVITKKPLEAQFVDVGYTFGDFSRNRFTMDANGYGDQHGNILYRVNIAHEESGSFVDFDYLDRTQIAPVVTFLLDEDTKLTWNGEWHRHNTIGFQGTPAVNGDPLFLSPNTFVGEPGNDFLNMEEFRQSLVLQRRLGEDLYFTLGAYSLFYDFPGSTTAAAQQVNPVPPLFVRSRSDIPLEDEQSQSVIANLAGEVTVGGMTHKVLSGIEYNYFDSASTFNSGVIATPFDVSNPVYTDPAATPVFSSDYPVFRQQRIGGYLQDVIEVNPYLVAMAGVRFDSLDFEFERNIGFGEVETEQTFYRTSPRVGLVYKPLGDDLLSFYYSYAQSFTPPGGGIYLNGDLQPILGETHESGIKARLLDNLALTAAGFYTTRENDAFNVQSITLVQVGEVRSQGAELNLIGSLTDYWSVIANYTYTDARLSDPDPTYDGARVRNVPFNTANLWTRYDIYCDECQTFGAALGLVYLGERPADLTNTLDLPGFTRWDSGLYYQRGRVSANLYLENLFDVQYAASSVNTQQIYQGAPFNARAAISFIY